MSRTKWQEPGETGFETRSIVFLCFTSPLLRTFYDVMNLVEQCNAILEYKDENANVSTK